MSDFVSLRARNRAFAATPTRNEAPRLPFLPHRGVYVITCVDPRTDPADFLRLRFGEAIVARTVGGRVTPAVIRDLAYISFLVEEKAPDGPYFEVAVIHHTDCGSRLLEDDGLRRRFATRTGYDEQALRALPATDPARTVRADVATLLAAPEVSHRITASGHVYDVATGLITTVVEPQPGAAPVPAATPMADRSSVALDSDGVRP